MKGGFFDHVTLREKEVNSLLCIGIDPDPSDVTKKLGKCDMQAVEEYCRSIILTTYIHALCFKPNIAFFEALGHQGVELLEKLCRILEDKDIPVILDCKRGDIGSTSKAYASCAYKYYKTGAVTANGYMGRDSLEPLIDQHDRGVFVLCKTSNPGSNDLQVLMVVDQKEPKPLYIHVAKMVQDINAKKSEAFRANGGGVGLVVGATDTEALKNVRSVCASEWILAPGVGAQGGDLDAALKVGLRPDGLGLIIPVSRGITNSSDMGLAAQELKERINQARRSVRQ